MLYNGGVLVGTGRDVLDQIAAAARASSWSVLHEGVDGGSGDPANEDYRQYVICVSNGEHTFGMGFSSPTTGTVIKIENMYVGYSAGSSIYDRGQEVFGNYLMLTGATCHIFSGPTAIYVVIETLTKSYRHFCFGTLIKNDNYNGGAFAASQYSYVSTYINRHAFPFANQVHQSYCKETLVTTWGGDGYGVTGQRNHDHDTFPYKCRGSLAHSTEQSTAFTQDLVKSCNYQFNNQSILFPIHCFVLRSGGFYSPIGYPPDIRAVNCRFIVDGSTVSLGGDSWMVFPIGQKSSPQSSLTPENTGLAYLVT